MVRLEADGERGAWEVGRLARDLCKVRHYTPSQSNPNVLGFSVRGRFYKARIMKSVSTVGFNSKVSDIFANKCPL